jgi:hypothetical protein
MNMRFRLRTLLIVVAIGPIALAGAWFWFSSRDGSLGDKLAVLAEKFAQWTMIGVFVVICAYATLVVTSVLGRKK